MTVESWLSSAIADAERRGLPDLKPLLETLARSTEALRRAEAAVSASAPGPPAEKKPDDWPGLRSITDVSRLVRGRAVGGRSRA